MLLPFWRRAHACVCVRRDLIAERDLLADRVVELEEYACDLRRLLKWTAEQMEGAA